MTHRLALRALAIAVLAAVPGAGDSPAAAAVIGNTGSSEQQVLIISGAERREVTLKPGERVTGVCPKGCTVRLVGVADGDYAIVEGNEIVSVEGGLMYFDGTEPPAPEGASADNPDKASPPGAAPSSAPAPAKPSGAKPLLR
ncbi:MAG: hypothetical protein NW205_07950 [Hyphomicrobiaceae bacterium]|nr:hypothetical protein [Hyphomicrobiaceae bacterium]